MALSAYERTVRRFRRDLLAAEQGTRNDLAAAYRDANRAIAARLQRMPEDETFRQLRLLELQRQIEAELARLTDEGATMIADGQRRMTRLGPEQAAGLVQAQAPELGVSFTQLPRAAFETIVGASGDGTPLRGVLSRYGAVAASEATQTLRNAIAEGWGPRETARRLRKILGVAQWQAETLARSEQLRAYRESTLMTYQNSGGLVTHYQRLAALDARTCPVCLSLHLTTYRADEAMPTHPNDRCTMVPVLRGREAPPLGETGQQWFDRQSPVVQRQILGKGKAELYSAGDLQLADLVVTWFDETWGPQVGEIPLRELVGRGRRAA